MNFLQKLFGLGSPTIIDMENALVLDVRSPAEFASGHLPGSINIPLQQLRQNLASVPKGKQIITCCASGMRSASAAQILRSQGYDATNGGSWQSLRTK